MSLNPYARAGLLAAIRAVVSAIVRVLIRGRL